MEARPYPRAALRRPVSGNTVSANTISANTVSWAAVAGHADGGAPGEQSDRDGRPMTVPGPWYLVLAACLFGIGAAGLLVRRNILVMYMCIELMLNAVNLTFVTFSRMLNDVGGQDAVFFVLVVAAAEVVVGLGIIVAIYRRRSGATADDISALKG